MFISKISKYSKRKHEDKKNFSWIVCSALAAKKYWQVIIMTCLEINGKQASKMIGKVVT